MTEEENKVEPPKYCEETMSYMPTPVTVEDLKVSEAITHDPTMYSDPHTNASNKTKWDRVREVFGSQGDATLFAALSYEKVYQDDDPFQAEAAAFVADLRAQYIQQRLNEKFTVDLHLMYLRNVQWMVRFRERARLHHINQVVKTSTLH